MSAGGFFFSNPTPAHLPARRGDENNAAVAGGLGGCGTAAAAVNVGLVGGCNAAPINMAAAPANLNPNVNMTCGGQHSAAMSNLPVQGNLPGTNSALGNVVVGYPTSNLGGVNMNINPAAINPAAINQSMVGQNINNLSGTGGNIQQSATTNGLGFGSFFFNPLSLFMGNGNANNNTPAANNINMNAALNSNTMGGNASNSMTNNNVIANAVLNSGTPGAYQNVPLQMAQVALTQATSQTLPGNAQVAAAPSASPQPLAYMTPTLGPTPCPTPPTPMFHDAHSSRPPSAAPTANGGTIATQVAAAMTQEAMDTSAMPQGTAAKGGIFSIVGSALGTVASYVNQSFLSGIPFHIADRAMKDSKATYAKWWEGGINSGDKRKREGGMWEEDGADGDADADPASGGHMEKKRKLESGRAVEGTGHGSSLSKSLKRNLDDMGVDTSCQFVEHQQQLLPQYEPMPVQSDVQGVDYSIIEPRKRRGQFDQDEKKSAEVATSSNGGDADSGEMEYNAFNHFDSMYDFGDDTAGKEEPQNVVSQASVGEKVIHQSALTYDSLGKYYMTNDDVDDEANAGPEKVNAATVTSHATPLDGTLSAIHELLDEKNRASEENEMLQMLRSPRDWVKKSIRSELIDALQAVQGDVQDKRFLSSLEILSNFYKTSGRDARVSPWCGRRSADDSGVGGGSYGYSGSEVGGPTENDLLEGNWVNMSRPNYVECLGQNAEDDFMYTLGRMSFDMFQPGGLVCSVQSTHNTIRIIGEREELPAFVPKSLREEVATLCDSGAGDTSNRPLLRSYDIAVSLTIEPPSSVGQPDPSSSTPTPTKRMRALMSVKGYVLPDPTTPNRLTVWFTGGKLSPARLSSRSDGCETDDEDHVAGADGKSAGAGEPSFEDSEDYGGFEEWSAMFAKGKWRKTLGERARAMAAKLLLGADIPNKMEEDGRMEYVLHRPVGGHSKVYVDVLYLDEDILIMRGHHGTVYALARSGVSQRYKALRGGADLPQ
ncbi:hypothetical protein ACHAXT_005226 [Thalassiosira profunda]